MTLGSDSGFIGISVQFNAIFRCSIAKHLGALTVCKRLFDYYHERPVLSEVVTDADSVAAILRFLVRIFVVDPCTLQFKDEFLTRVRVFGHSRWLNRLCPKNQT